jgi:hypothetical protein
MAAGFNWEQAAILLRSEVWLSSYYCRLKEVVSLNLLQNTESNIILDKEEHYVGFVFHFPGRQEGIGFRRCCRDNRSDRKIGPAAQDFGHVNHR